MTAPGPRDREMQHTVPMAVLSLAGALGCMAFGSTSVDTVAFAARAERLYHAAGERYDRESTDPSAGWHFARACYDWADFATNDTQRATVAQEGISAARAVLRQHPELAPAQYYLAMNLGQLARTRLLGALPLVSEMEKHFKDVLWRDPDFDHAGPDRCLGLLYRDAPGWPLSLGSKSKARTHLRRAVQRCPHSIENRLNLIEALISWSEETEAARQYEDTAALLPNARTRFAGDEWAASWADWDRRWLAISKKLEGRRSISRRPAQ